MKTNLQKRVLFGLLAVLGVVIAIAALNVVIAFIAPAGAILMTGVAVESMTETVVRDNSTTPDLMMEDIEPDVIEMLPDKYPLDTIIRNLGTNRGKKVDCNSQIKRYYSVASREWSDTIDGTASGAGTSVGVPAKEYTYASGDGLAAFWLAVSDETMWHADDTFIIFDVPVFADMDVAAMSGPATKTTYDIVFYIESNTSGVLKIKPINGILGDGAFATVYVMPDITSDMILYRLGSAKTETAASTTAYQLIPEPDEQYLQYFMAQIEEGEFYRRNAKEVKWGKADFERMAAYDLRGQMESAFLWGAKARVTNSTTNDKRYTTGGITRLITNEAEYGTGGTNREMTEDDYLSWMKTVFSGNSAGVEKIMFAGSNFIKNMHLIESVQKQNTGKNIAVKWGVKFNEIETNFGTIYVKHHIGLTLHGKTDHAYILDPEHVRKATFIPLGVKELDLKSAGTKNVDAVVLSECSALYLTYPEAHLKIKPKA